MSAAPRRGLKAGRANIITQDQFIHLLKVVEATSYRTRFHGLRDFAILMFSFKAALRACEISALNWRNVLDAEGRIGKRFLNPETQEEELFFEVPNAAAKKEHGRLLPMHPALATTLKHLRETLGPDRSKPTDPIIQSTRHPNDPAPRRMSAHALVLYLLSVYERAGLDGSSHSGRRTALTKLAQTHGQHGCSLIDVQHFAGHANLEDTYPYVEDSPHVGKMIRSL